MIQTLTDAPEGKFWPVCQTCVHLCPALGILKSNLDSENLGLIPKIILNSIIFQKLLLIVHLHMQPTVSLLHVCIFKIFL